MKDEYTIGDYKIELFTASLNPCSICHYITDMTYIYKSNDSSFYCCLCTKCTEKYNLDNENKTKRKTGLALLKMKKLI